MGFFLETLQVNNITLANISAADFIFDTTSNGVTIAGSNSSIYIIWQFG